MLWWALALFFLQVQVKLRTAESRLDVLSLKKPEGAWSEVDEASFLHQELEVFCGSVAEVDTISAVSQHLCQNHCHRLSGL